MALICLLGVYDSFRHRQSLDDFLTDNSIQEAAGDGGSNDLFVLDKENIAESPFCNLTLAVEEDGFLITGLAGQTPRQEIIPVIQGLMRGEG